MAIKFYKLIRELDKKNMNRGDLQNAIGASSATIAKIFRHEYIALEVVDRICEALDCQPEDIMEYVSDHE